MMALPQAAVRKAAEATRLIQAAAAAENGDTGLPAAEVEALKRQLAETQENLRKANQSYDSLRGKFDAEVPRQSAELREARAALTAATAKVTELEALVAKKFEAGDVASLTDEERQLMGGDMVKGMSKIAREIADAAIAKAVQPINKRVDDFARQSDAAYWQTLEEGVPDWESVDRDQRFLAWLNQVDPLTQRVRMDQLKRAEAARQGNRVVEIFRAFKEGREIGAPASGSSPNPLDKRQDPPPGGGGDPPADELADGKKIWTRAEIALFYSEKRQGAWRSKPDEARKIEQDIFAAYGEGRVRG